MQSGKKGEEKSNVTGLRIGDFALQIGADK
jgi:hypothetical protein